MYIEEVTLEGFLSYSSKATLGPLSPGVNIIVGQNGAGKSNLLYAIESLISMDAESLTQQQRQSLLSTTPGVKVRAAVVQVVLNNTSHRLPSDQDIVTVTRTISPTSTSLKIGTTIVGKKQLVDYLHVAGFSSENSFYILRQGQVREVLLMSSRDRLRMVMRFAGRESLKELQKSSHECSDGGDTDRDRTDEIAAECRKKLEESEEELKAAKQYKQLELDIRTINAVFLEREAEVLMRRLKQVESDIAKLAPQHGTVKESYLRISQALEKNKQKLKKLKERKEDLQSRLEDLEERLNEATAGVAREELLGKQLCEEIAAADTTQQQLAAQLEVAERDMEAKTKELAEILEVLRALEEREDELQGRVDELISIEHSTMQRLIHSNAFTSTQDRNTWIEEELERLESTLQELQRQYENLRLDIQNCTVERDNCISEHQTAQAELATLWDFNRSMRTDLVKLQKEGYAALDRCKHAKRLEEDCLKSLNRARNEIIRVQPHMAAAMGMAELNGWQGLKKVLQTEENGVAGDYLGMLADHLQVPDGLTTAVAAALGKRLFTHLVRNVSAAKVLLHKFNALKAPGCLGFQVLDKVHLRDRYPSPQGNDVRRLVDQVVCTSAELSPLLPYWLGDWLLCSSLEVAQEASRLYKANCVTAEGDIVRSRGVMVGGYRDPKKNEFKVYQEYTYASDLLHSAEASRDKALNVGQQLAKCSLDASTDIQTREVKIARNMDAISSVESRVTLLQSQLSGIEENIKTKEQALAKVSQQMEHNTRWRDALVNERSTGRTESLSATAQQQLCEGSRELQQLRRQLKALRRDKMQLLHNKNTEESMLKFGLSPRVEGLTKERHSLEEKVAAQRNELELSKTRLEAFEQARQALKAQIEELANESTASEDPDLDRSVQELSEEKAHCYEEFEAALKQLELLTVKRENTLSAVAEVKNKAGMFGKVSKKLNIYRNMEDSELEYERALLQEALDRMPIPEFSHGWLIEKVVQQLDAVAWGLKDVDKTRSQAGDLTRSQKDEQFEKINFSVKQVCKYFEDLFQKFVPQGRATIVLYTQTRRSQESSEEELDYHGLEFTASFSPRAPLQCVSCFSGGQQTVVALCFILALQKCDPAPFYIFDEVDSCLDTEHRQALANILEELSASSQFICTTFRPELASKGTLFRVTQEGGVSSISPVTDSAARRQLQAAQPL
ncbi:structural maintenance of chromosomes protein 3-like [Haemaphysalis longicornis]